eukprot:CAMPEP_0119132542 /NCGR_PEP_ID=MMETSP1310-20130426/11889_1 /TAXON_ID=464262 /ORGANISM="Genus nov. species nov., Strain RCC2339" /LENGTH=261 /DNA_ID=CAMNT_0007123179 /DNA_START=132 /DNA_END=914 /DNA_ORIENTATION=-
MPNLTFLEGSCSARSEARKEREEGMAQDLEERFQVAQVAQPQNFLRDTFSRGDAPAKRIEFAHGTTTLAFVFQGGIVIAVDSRATRGPLIASQSVKKVVEINDYMLATLAGSAADTQYFLRDLGKTARLHELDTGKRMSLAAASKCFVNTIYSYKGYGLSMGCMLAGWDETGPHLYYVDSDGTRNKSNLFSVGSGSTWAYGILDSAYSFDLSVEDALELGRRAIAAAVHRDAYSGGTINVYHMKKDGWEKVSADDNNDLFW